MLPIPRFSVLAPLLGFLLVSATASGSRAQTPYPSAQLDRHVMPPLPSDGVAVAQPAVPGHLTLTGQLQVDYANDPLVFEAATGDSGSERFALVSHQTVAQLGFALGLFDNFAVFTSLPLQLSIQGRELPGQPAGRGAAVGDFRLGGRAVLSDDGHLAAALQLALTASTSPDSNAGPGVAGETGTTVDGKLLGRYQDGPLAVSLSAGLFLRKDKTFTGIDFTNELTFALGAYLKVHPMLSLLLETFGNTPMANVGAADTTVIEALLGARMHLPERITASLAGGTGLTRGYGAPDLRLIASIGMELPLVDQPISAEPLPEETVDEAEAEEGAEGTHEEEVLIKPLEDDFEPIHTDY